MAVESCVTGLSIHDFAVFCIFDKYNLSAIRYGIFILYSEFYFLYAIFVVLLM